MSLQACMAILACSGAIYFICDLMERRRRTAKREKMRRAMGLPTNEN